MTEAVRERKSLVDTIAEHLASGDLKLPVYSSVAQKLQSTLDDPNSTAEQIERVLSADPALASQILKVANSSFYSGLAQVATIKAAMMRLGSKQIVDIAILCTQREQYKARDPMVADYMKRLWRHSLACALGSRWLAEKAGNRELGKEAFLAGLFHDIGSLVILKVVEDLRRSGGEAVPPALLVEVLDALHAGQGARLIKHWNLPESFATIAESHHSESAEGASTLALIVRICDKACMRLGIDVTESPDLVLSGCPEARLLGLKEVTLAELEIVLEDALQTLG